MYILYTNLFRNTACTVLVHHQYIDIFKKSIRVQCIYNSTILLQLNVTFSACEYNFSIEESIKTKSYRRISISYIQSNHEMVISKI